MKEALNHRKQLKARKPTFLSQGVRKKARVPAKWRKPRGVHNKMRLGHGGHPVMVDQGWRSPRSVRGLSPQGLEIVRIHTLAELASVDPKTQGALIASSVSMRNKIVIITECENKKITVLNRNIDGIKKRADEKSKQIAAKRVKSVKDEKAPKKIAQDAESTQTQASTDTSAPQETRAVEKSASKDVETVKPKDVETVKAKEVETVKSKDAAPADKTPTSTDKKTEGSQ